MVMQDMGHTDRRDSHHRGAGLALRLTRLLFRKAIPNDCSWRTSRSKGWKSKEISNASTCGQDADGVSCDLKGSNGITETVTVGWLAGCDGARSIARHKLQVDFIGVTEDSGFILADAKTVNGPVEDSILLSSGPHGVVIIFPVKPGVWRFFGLREHSDDRSQPTLEEIQRHVDNAGLSHLRLFEPEWLSYFAVNERVASRNRAGRIFLLGDASHIHSPAGGQGMNTGMQDAFNLGWKLKRLTSGQGDSEAIAESYFAERHPVAEKVVHETSRLLHFGIMTNPVVRRQKRSSCRSSHSLNHSRSGRPLSFPGWASRIRQDH